MVKKFVETKTIDYLCIVKPLLKALAESPCGWDV